ncbi:MAG: DUF2079 domain-containing protein [Polyangiaceae bacterium]
MTTAEPTVNPPEAESQPASAVTSHWAELKWLPALSRAGALFGFIGCSAVLWAQCTFSSKWVKPFVLQNTLEADKRKLLLLSLAAGFGVGVLFALSLAVWLKRRQRDLATLERTAWFASPLLLLGALPLAFRHSIWRDRHLDLMFFVLLLLFVVEAVTYRALANVPGWVSSKVQWVRERAPGWLSKYGPAACVALAALAYAVVMSRWAIMRHYKMESAISDLGISENLMYNALAGKFMEAPIFSGPAGGLPFLAGHAQFGQYLLLPFYALFPRAETLLVLQCTAMAAAAIPLFALCRRYLAEWTSALLAIAYLAYYPIHGGTLYEMTYLPIACPFILGTLWALDAGRYRLLVPLFLAALSMREDVSIGLAIVATICIMGGHRTRAALAVALVSTAYFVVVRFKVMQVGGGWSFPENMYAQLLPPEGPKTFGGVLRTLVSNPLYTFGTLTVNAKLTFLLHLLLPLAFIPLRHARFWPILLPGTVTTLITTGYAPTVSVHFHYPLLWAPYLWASLPIALATLSRTSGVRRGRAAFAALMFCSAALTFNLGAFARPPDFMVGFRQFDFKITPQHAHRLSELRELVAMLPKDASVCMTEVVGAHAAGRVNALSLRGGIQDADYLLVSRKDFDVVGIVPGLDSKKYGVLARRGDFALLKRGHDTSGNAKLRADWKL